MTIDDMTFEEIAAALRSLSMRVGLASLDPASEFDSDDVVFLDQMVDFVRPTGFEVSAQGDGAGE